MSDMEQPVVIADASVIIKFFINEKYSTDARRLRDAFVSDQIELVEPSLFAYEVINGIRYSRAKRFTPTEMKEVVDAIEEYAFPTLAMSESLASMAVDLTFKYKISLYDAVYVALANVMGATLYTADDKLISSVDSPFVRHIKSFK